MRRLHGTKKEGKIFLVINQNGREHFADLGLYEMIILTLILLTWRIG